MERKILPQFMIAVRHPESLQPEIGDGTCCRRDAIFQTQSSAPALSLTFAILLLAPAILWQSAAAQTSPPWEVPNVTIPLNSQVRYTPEGEWDGITVVPIGETAWEELYLVHQSRYQVVAILPGLPEGGLEGPGIDLLSPEPMGPPAPRRLLSPLPQKRGWPVHIREGSVGSATPVDLGGETGLAVASPSGWIHLFDSHGQRVSGWPAQTEFPVSSHIAVGDLDGDGQDDIVVACVDGSLHALSQTGQELEGWPVRIPGTDARDHIRGCPTVADLDGDGAPEVVAATHGGFVAAWSCHGSLAGPLWPMRVPSASDPVNQPGIHSSPAVVDLDGDGLREVVLGSCAYNVWAWHSDGRPVRGWPLQVPGKARAGFSSPVVGDLDGNGTAEVVLGTDLGFEGGAKVLVADVRGRFLSGWPADSPERIHGAPALADLNGDGHPDVVTATVGGDGSLLALDGATGKPLPGWPVGVDDVSFNSSPIIVDVNGDGSPDIVAAGSEAGFSPKVKLVAYDIQGDPVSGWPISLDSEEILSSSPLVVDLERDGLLDLVLATENDGRLYVWELPTADHPGAAPWPMAQADAGRTGTLSARPSGQPPATPAPAPEIRTPSIDPENPLMTIFFSLSREESVQLSILNLMGQRVRRLLDYRLPPGSYNIVWDGKDEGGRIQPAGIYFYELRIGAKSATHQMLLLK